MRNLYKEHYPRSNSRWTKEEIITVLQFPRGRGWARACGKQLGRTAKAVALLDLAVQQHNQGNDKYMTDHLRGILKSMQFVTSTGIREVTTSQTGYAEEATMIPPTQKTEKRPLTASEIAERIEVELENIKTSFVQLGEAIVQEQYKKTSQTLKEQEARIFELEQELAKAKKQPQRSSIKSLFNLK